MVRVFKPRPRSRAIGALVCVALVLTACGTTVPLAGGQVPTGGDPLTLATDAAGMPLPPGSATSSDGLTAGGSQATSPAGGTGGTGAAAAPSGAGEARPNGAPAASTSAPGTASTSGNDPVQVGYFITKNAEQLFSAVGYDDLSPGNTENQVKAMVKWANNHGGLDGHPIEPVLAVWDATAGNTAQQRQAACAKWFQDNNAIAVVAESFDVFQACATQANVPLLVKNVLPQTQRRFAAAPTMVTASVPADDRAFPAWVTGMRNAGYFKPEGLNTEPVIGVMHEDLPDAHHSYNNILVPSLARYGYEVAAKQTFTVTNFSAQINSAILRFREEGVTHVMLYDGGGLAMFFMASAESQAYRPRYGLMSYSQLATLQDQAPPEQLARTVAVGWLPDSDTQGKARPRANAATKLCVDIMTKAGEDMLSPGTRHTALTYCDLTLLLLAMARTGGGVTTQHMMGGLHGLGSSYRSALTFATDYTAPRRDGPAVYRTLAYNDGCSCFQYTSRTRGF